MTSAHTSEKDDQWVPFSIPLTEAQTRVKNWIDADPGSIKPTQVRAFVVRREDFKELLNQHKTEFIRIYIGLETNDEDKQKPRPCVMLVSADYQQTIDAEAPDSDRIVDLIGWEKPTPDASEEDYHVFDFSKPCPSHCDPESPLFVRNKNGDD